MKTTSIFSIKLIIYGLVSAGLLAAWVFTAYQSRSFFNEVKVIETESKSKSSERSYLLTVKNILRDSSTELASINARFINGEQVPEFITALENEIGATGVKGDFQSITFEGKNLVANLIGTGSWNQVIDLIATLDKLPYAMSIRNLKLSKMSGTEDDMWKFGMEINEYIIE